MMQGYLGLPEGGWPKVLQKIILDSAGEKPLKGRPGAEAAEGRLRATAARSWPRRSAASRATSTC